MKYLLADAEWNGDEESVLHCVSVAEYPSGSVKRFTNNKSFEVFAKANYEATWVFHAGLTADIPVINKIYGYTLIDPEKVIDTFVASRLFNYKKFQTHGLDELGKYLGVYKGNYTGGWEKYTPEMGDYCDQDVEVLRAIAKFYWKQLTDPSWAKSLETEHGTAILCADLQRNGFKFKIDEAIHLLGEVKNEMKELEDSFKVSFPAKLVEVNRLKYRKTKDGKLFKTVVNAMAQYPKTVVEGDELVCYDYKEFKPGSPKDRIDVLWDAGWKPFDKTKGHIQCLRK